MRNRRNWKSWCLAAVTGVLLGVHLHAAADTSAISRPEERRARLKAMMEQQRQAALERRQNSRIRAFVDQDGVPIGAGPGYADRLRSRPEFTEVHPTLTGVTVQPRVARLSIDQFTDELVKSCVEESATRYGLDPALVYAVIRAESNFNPYAVSSAGARGLMQLMPGTAAEMGIRGEDIFHPAKNIDGGCQYLARMLELFGDLRLALAAYNAGPGAVREHGGVPPYKETRDYISRVNRYHAEFRGGGPVVPAALPRPSQVHRHQVIHVASNADRFHTVRFKSGLNQPATKVTEVGDYYHISYNGKVFPAHKDLVERIDPPGRS